MATKNNIRRNYLIIKRIMRGDNPSIETIINYLEAHDCVITLRTIQRDIANIRADLGVDITYDGVNNGYYINPDGSFDLSKILYFINLSESSDIVLQSLKDKKDVLQYLSISPSTAFKGIGHIGSLLQAIRNNLVIEYQHLNYEKQTNKIYRAEPYLLKEFEGRWYLFAYIREKAAFRTFGLDRISDLIVTDAKFERERKLAETATKFENVYGLVYEPEQNTNAPIKEVRLRFSPLMINHLSALPLHRSQLIDGDIVTLNVIINPEIENKILSYGEHVEVLAPQSLRDKIKERLSEAFKKYAP